MSDEFSVDETRYGYVYRITNLINNKTYIGQHKIVKGEKWLTYMGSGRLIRQAIHKYGINNFHKEILCYADFKTDLNEQEKEFITQELIDGHSEYNIDGSDSSLRAKIDELHLSDEDLLTWYFDKNMSYNDLAKKLNCSIPTIFYHMKKLRDSDPRFLNIVQGDNRGKYSFSEEAKNKALEITSQKVICDNCKKEISYANYSKHYNACSNSEHIYDNGFRKHECAEDDCDVLIYLKNTYCKKHYGENAKNGKNFGDSVKRGGLIASHNRWHVKRGVVSDTCDLCKIPEELTR